MITHAERNDPSSIWNRKSTSAIAESIGFDRFISCYQLRHRCAQGSPVLQRAKRAPWPLDDDVGEQQAGCRKTQNAHALPIMSNCTSSITGASTSYIDHEACLIAILQLPVILLSFIHGNAAIYQLSFARVLHSSRPSPSPDNSPIQRDRETCRTEAGDGSGCI